MDFLETLKQDPSCLYIYNWGPYIYGLQKEPTEYLVVVKDDWKTDLLKWEKNSVLQVHNDNNIQYNIWSISSWFNKVLKSNIDCWECACLNKKFIIKEHVKLMMSTNPLHLRELIDGDIKYCLNKDEHSLRVYWNTIRECKFANQIINNHKIVNFKEANSDYEILKNSSVQETFEQLLQKPYELLKSKTDDILRRSKIEKILQKEKKNG